MPPLILSRPHLFPDRASLRDRPKLYVHSQHNVTKLPTPPDLPRHTTPDPYHHHPPLNMPNPLPLIIKPTGPSSPPSSSPILHPAQPYTSIRPRTPTPVRSSLNACPTPTSQTAPPRTRQPPHKQHIPLLLSLNENLLQPESDMYYEEKLIKRKNKWEYIFLCLLIFYF